MDNIGQSTQALIYAVCTPKGGIGKTELVKNGGASLIELGYKVLVVDLDSQGNLTKRSGFAPKEVFPTIFEVLLSSHKQDGAVSIEDAILKSPIGFDIVPANKSFSSIGLILAQEVLDHQSAPTLLAEALESVREEYDFILIDIRPGLDLLSSHAFTAADRVIIPVEPKNECLDALEESIETVVDIQQSFNPNLQISGIVFTKVMAHYTQTKEFMELAQTQYGEHVHIFKSVIKVREVASLANMVNESILSFAPKSDIATAYRNLAKEVLDRG